MPFPKINYCLLCEDMRAEKYNKLTLLGFYGVLPNVVLLVKELGKPVDKLLFVVSVGSPSETFKIAVNILNPNKEILVKGGEGEFSADLKKNESFAIALLFQGAVFNQSGVHTLQIIANGKEQYANTFNVDVADPSLFQ